MLIMQIANGELPASIKSPQEIVSCFNTTPGYGALILLK